MPRKLPWKYYTSALNADGNFWNAFQAVQHIRYSRYWKKDVISPQTRFFADLKKEGLGAVTWITPTCANSDHAGCDSDTGPKWVASLVNAIGESRTGNRRRSSSFGTIPAAGTITFHPKCWTTTGWGSGCRC